MTDILRYDQVDNPDREENSTICFQVIQKEKTTMVQAVIYH